MRSRDAKAGRERRPSCTLHGMGRGGGDDQTSAAAELSEPFEVRRAWSEAQRRLAGEPGISIVGSGRLDEEWAGHPAEAPYLIVRADCSLERQRAHEILGDIAGVPEKVWRHGWMGNRLPDGDVVTDLRIFPGQTPVPSHA
jgi:hypothetical protein